jgi:hypothetical protein
LAAATTEGLLIYALDDCMYFDPTDLDLDVTPANAKSALAKKRYTLAMIMSLQLNERALIESVVMGTPVRSVPLVVQSVPVHRIQRLLVLVSDAIAESPHVEFLLIWAREILTAHGAYFKARSFENLTTMRALNKSIHAKYQDLAKMCNQNKYLLTYLSSANFAHASDPAVLRRSAEAKQAEDAADAAEEAAADATLGVGLPAALASVGDPSYEQASDVTLKKMDDAVLQLIASSSGSAKSAIARSTLEAKQQPGDDDDSSSSSSSSSSSDDDDSDNVDQDMLLTAAAATNTKKRRFDDASSSSASSSTASAKKRQRRKR